MAIDSSELLSQARAVRGNAYAPYSRYEVGAALLDEQGRVHMGVNVENIAYGSTLCAERAAVLAMVAAGGKRISALAVATEDGGSPCGACLQVICEFSDPDLPIYLAGTDSFTETSLVDLLPHTFNSPAVRHEKKI